MKKRGIVLVAALATLTDLPWRLAIVGAADRNPACAAALRRQITEADLQDRIEIAGAVSQQRLDELYAEADAFVLASRFEGYGMAYAEAIGHGLPVIGTTAGAIPDTVPSQAAILVAPDDGAALAAALRRVIGDPATRATLAAEATKVAARLPTWRQSAAKISQMIEGLS
jgi:glycosyltransferase involved in cell wall biosynthesis